MFTTAKRLAAVLVLVAPVTVQAAAYFNGNAFYSQAPVSQLGPIASNTIVMNNGPTSITVSGVVKVQVPPGAVSGTLIQWDVDRLLNPGYGSGNMITTTTLSGFSQPPAFGTYGNTFGTTYGALDQYPGVSASTIPLSLVNGAATWNQITVQSSVFFYTSINGLHYLRQHFELDGVQLNGIGGLWTIDLPITTTVTLIPEPASITALLGGLGQVVCRRGHRQR